MTIAGFFFVLFVFQFRMNTNMGNSQASASLYISDIFIFYRYMIAFFKKTL